MVPKLLLPIAPLLLFLLFLLLLLVPPPPPAAAAAAAAALLVLLLLLLLHRIERKCDFPCEEEAHCLSCCFETRSSKGNLIVIAVKKVRLHKGTGLQVSNERTRA
jgi:hypothetical protein